MGVNKKAQEEIIGFVLIVVLIAIVAVIFLSISLRKAPSVANNELVGQFLPAMMRLNIICGEEQVNMKELTQKCVLGERCGEEDACSSLKANLTEAIKSSWNIGSESTTTGFILNISKSGQIILGIKEGSCKAGKSGAETLIPIETGDRSEIVSVRMEVCG